MLRVLTLSTLFPDSSRPNFGIFVEKQTRALAAQPGIEVRVVAPIGLPAWPLALHPRYRTLAALPQHETWRGLDVHRPRFRVTPWGGGRSMPQALARSLLPVLRDIHGDFPFDVIDAEFFFPDAPAAMRLAQTFEIPFSAKARGADIHHWGAQPGCRDQIAAAGNATDGLLAVSGAMRHDMAAMGISAERIRVHHTGVDLDRFAPGDRVAAKAALGIDGPLAVSAGALIPRKSHEIAIAAVARLPGVSLLIAGEGPERMALERRIAASGAADRIRLLGAIAHDRLPDLLRAADVGVLVSTSEGLANFWVEAVASGVPVVASDVGGARELIDRTGAGRIVARDVGAVANAIGELLENPIAPERVREAALRFTWEANGTALAAHLRALADGYQALPSP